MEVTKKVTKIIKKPKTNFTRFVEIGRVCLINYGPFDGKICVIIDVVDQNRALVSGPENITGVPRHAINFKRLILTSIKIKIGRGVRQKVLTKEFTEQKVQEKWENSGLFKKQLSRNKRANMNDFDRFKCMIAKKRKNKIIKEAEKKILHARKWKGKEPKRKIKGQGKSAGKKETTGKKTTGKEKPAPKSPEKPAEKPAEKPTTKPEAKGGRRGGSEKQDPKPVEKTEKGGDRGGKKGGPEKQETKPVEKGGEKGGRRGGSEKQETKPVEKTEKGGDRGGKKGGPEKQETKPVEKGGEKESKPPVEKGGKRGGGGKKPNE